jgi:hypothetical protein
LWRYYQARTLAQKQITVIETPEKQGQIIIHRIRRIILANRRLFAAVSMGVFLSIQVNEAKGFDTLNWYSAKKPYVSNPNILRALLLTTLAFVGFFMLPPSVYAHDDTTVEAFGSFTSSIGA